MNGEVWATGTNGADSGQLRVCVVEFLGRGGLLHYAYQLCTALADLGVAVELLTSRNYELDEKRHNFRVVKLWNLWDPRPELDVVKRSTASGLFHFARRSFRAVAYYRAWFTLRQYLRRNRPDIVQFGEIRFAGDYLPLVALSKLGITMVNICHNVVPFDTSSRSQILSTSDSTRRIFKKIYSLFDLIFVHSEQSWCEFVQAFGKMPNIVVIPHGNEQLFADNAGDCRESTRIKLGITEGQPVALFFGTLTKYKGLDLLIDAFSHVVSKVPNARLIIAGFPNPDIDIEALKARIREKGLTNSVVLDLRYIPLDEVSSYFNLARAVVFPYSVIFQSGVLQIAYSLSKPVVATAVGGLREAVLDGETGYLVEPNQPDAFAETLMKLLMDRDSAERMGRRARHLSETVYSWNAIASKVRNHYIETLSIVEA